MPRGDTGGSAARYPRHERETAWPVACALYLTKARTLSEVIKIACATFGWYLVLGPSERSPGLAADT